MKNRVTFALLALLTIVIASCKKEIATTGTKEFDLDNVHVLPLDFSYLATKSKVTFQDEKTDISFTATIRVKQDSLIWMSLSPALGIEAVRGLITQDSIYIINRLDRTYSVFDFTSLSGKFNFDITYDLVQAMLLGDMPFGQREEDRILKRGRNILIHQEEGNIAVDNYIDPEKMKTERVQLYETSSTNTLTLLYDNFQAFTDVFFPYSSKIVLSYKDGNDQKTTLIDIDHGKAEIANAALQFPFNIPQKYDRK